jgi:hypothetical protein
VFPDTEAKERVFIREKNGGDVLYAQEGQWSSAKIHAEKARELGFTGLAAQLLQEIRQLEATNPSP